MASFKNLISNTSAQISSGGTITGDLVINGDLQVDGGGSLSFDEIIEGTQVIDVTNTEALLVRKNGDGGDVFTVNTTNSRVNVGTPTGTGIFEVEGSVDNDYAGRFENKHSGGYGALVKIAGTTANDLAFQVRASSTNILTINGDSKIGIGTSSPQKKVDIVDIYSTGGSSNEDLQLLIRGGNADLDPTGDSIGIGFGYGSADNYVKSGIVHEFTNANGTGTLHFCTSAVAGADTINKGDAKLSIDSS